MSAGSKFKKLAGAFLLSAAVACAGSPIHANAESAHSQRKAKKPQLPPLPSGPLGPVPQIPLDSIAPVPPQVTYENGQLTIIAPNSTLGDVLRAVRKQTGADIEIPTATDRVVTHLGPGPAREVMADLLNGSRFNYILLGSPENASLLTRVVLVAKSNTESAVASNPPSSPQPMPMQAGIATPPPPDDAQDAPDAEPAPDENADDTTNVDQAAADADQQQPDQPGVKTPQQMLQEMQQRQLQMQQQQQQQPNMPGQPIPGARPPQDQ
jgi:hypothetical protein